MIGKQCRRWASRLGVLIAVCSTTSAAQSPALIGLDHVPVAVRDLEGAMVTYRAPGFALKSGRVHANGIRNAHVKFPDGAGVELLTAREAVDALSAHYAGHIRVGDGPAFISFHARDTGRLHTALRDGGYEVRTHGDITELALPEFAFLFLVRDNRSSTDRPEHFAHANGAFALRAFWVATAHGHALGRLLVQLGGQQQRRRVFAPLPVDAIVVSLNGGEVLILPESHQLVAGRPVIGASFRVPDLPLVRRTLTASGVVPWTGARATDRVVVVPGDAHGLWIEFRSDS